MKFDVVGSGCRKCIEMEKRVREAVSKLGLDAEIEHIYDVNRIMELGIITTPALMMDGKIILSGMLPTVDYLVSLIKSKAA